MTGRPRTTASAARWSYRNITAEISTRCTTASPSCRHAAIGDYGYAILEVLSDAAGDRADFVIYE